LLNNGHNKPVHTVGYRVNSERGTQFRQWATGILINLEWHPWGGRRIVKIRNGRKIEVEPMDWTIKENGKVRASISQLPLRLAWAITVHKSQGMSLDEAVMDLSQVFEKLNSKYSYEELRIARMLLDKRITM